MSERIRMVTKNKSRGIVVYKDKDRKVFKDIGLREFIILFAQAIKIPVKDIIESFIKQLGLDLSDPNDIDQAQEYINMITDVNLASQGNKAKFAPSMLKGITAGTLLSNLLTV